MCCTLKKAQEGVPEEVAKGEEASGPGVSVPRQAMSRSEIADVAPTSSASILATAEGRVCLQRNVVETSGNVTSAGNSTTSSHTN